MVGDLFDNITRANFHNEIFRGYDITGWNLQFSYKYLHGAAALPAIFDYELYMTGK